jgi:predicted RNA-binding protein
MLYLLYLLYLKHNKDAWSKNLASVTLRNINISEYILEYNMPIDADIFKLR